MTRIKQGWDLFQTPQCSYTCSMGFTLWNIKWFESNLMSVKVNFLREVRCAGVSIWKIDISGFAPSPCKQVVNPAMLRMCPCGKKTIDSRYISIWERKWEYFSSSRECRIYFRKKTPNPYIHAVIVIDDVQSWRGNIALYQRFNPVSLLNCTKITLHVQKTRLTYGQPWRSGCIDIFTQRF